MATQYLYRIQVQEQDCPPDPARHAWSYADGYDLIPVLLREMAQCQRPVTHVTIQLVETFTPTAPPVPEEGD